MSKTHTETIRARLRDPNHPTGKRNRAGLQFTTDVQYYEVTPEQFALIESDPAIHIMGAKVQEEEGSDDDTNTGATVTTQTPPATTTTPPGGDEVKPENLERATKGRLIEILIQELKQDPTKDFDPEATNDALRGLIVTLREMATKDPE